MLNPAGSTVIAGRIGCALRPTRREPSRCQEVAMPLKGQRHAPEALGPNGSIARGTRFGKMKRAALDEQRRAAARIAPWEILEAARTGTVPDHRRDYVADAVDRACRSWPTWAAPSSYPRRARARAGHAARGAHLEMLNARVLQSEAIDLEARREDLDAARRAAREPPGARPRARRERSARSAQLPRVLAQRAQDTPNGAGATNGASPDADVEPAQNRAACAESANGGAVPRSEDARGAAAQHPARAAR